MSVRKSKPVLITLANHKGIQQSNTSIKIFSISKYMLLIQNVEENMLTSYSLYF